MIPRLFKPQIRKYYTFVESARLDRSAIKIVKGPMKDIIYTYGKCAFKENETGALTAKYEYTIVENPHEQINRKKFEKLVGDILMDIVQDSIENNKVQNLLEKEIEIADD